MALVRLTRPCAPNGLGDEARLDMLRLSLSRQYGSLADEDETELNLECRLEPETVAFSLGNEGSSPLRPSPSPCSSSSGWAEGAAGRAEYETGRNEGAAEPSELSRCEL